MHEITAVRDPDGTYRLRLPDGKVQTGLTFKEAVDMAEITLANMRKAEGKHENDNYNQH